ncbi:MAG: hypothetical protein FWG50_13195, partial [Kiritimatiellaeota bacterium]|nr:hypothetical protein [Kiritimatiellota bacterium]
YPAGPADIDPVTGKPTLPGGIIVDINGTKYIIPGPVAPPVSNDPYDAWPEFSSRKKIFEWGWYSPDTAQLRANHVEWQQTKPFDGLGVLFRGYPKPPLAPVPAGVPSTFITSRELWDYSRFEEAVADMNACTWTTFTDNFITTRLTSARTSDVKVKWYDDDGWAMACNNAAVLAKAAKNAGMKGFFSGSGTLQFGDECRMGQRHHIPLQQQRRPPSALLV